MLYAVRVRVSFFPAVPAGIPSSSGTEAITDNTGYATFDQLIFWGVRGQSYTMDFTVDGAIEPLQAPINVTLCEGDQFVYNATSCQACPTGAACDGTATLSALVNFWRTGWYDDNKTYHPNEKEQRFIRCDTSACEGGPASSCRTGLGPQCGTCDDGEVYSLLHARCVSCEHPAVVYIGVYLAYAIIQTAVLQVLVRLSIQSLHHTPGLGTVGARIIIQWVQILAQVSLTSLLGAALECRD